MTQSTQEIRSEIKAARRSLDQTERDVAAYLIAKKLASLRVIQRTKNIAAYLPVNGEVDCRFFIRMQKLRKKRIFIPVLDSDSLKFAPLISGYPLQKNRYEILEPVYKKCDLLTPRELDIVITPLVAFDAACNRIGMGGGYYDRSFAFRKSRRVWRRPLLIGVGYDFQRVTAIQSERWDIPVDAVVTERQQYGRC